MSLQDIYYLTNIIFTSLLVVLLVVIIIMLFYIMKVIGKLSDNLNEKIDQVGRITQNAEDVASSVSAVASGAIRKVSNLIGNER